MNQRLISEAELLLSENAYITVDTIATSLNYSNKTIRNDLIILEDWLKEFDLTLDKKIGVGIAIRGDELVKLKVLNNIAIKSNFIEDYSPEDRLNYILVKLFISDSRLRIKDLANNLHVCRATIHKDLLAVEKWLENRNIELIRKSNYGIELIANERDLRKAILHLICSNKSYLELKDILSSEDVEVNIISPSLKIFKEVIDIDFIRLKDIVLSTESLINYNLSDESLLTLLVDIAIAFKRMSTSNYINLSKDSQEKLRETIEFIIASDLCKNLETSFDITFPEDELYNISLHILCSKKNDFDTNIISMDNFDSSEMSELLAMTKELILHWEKTLKLPLSQDNELLSSLLMHLKPVINSIKYGLSTSNPIFDEIMKYYPNTFNVVKESIYISEAYLNCKINDDEIGYITLHLASAIDRAKKPLKTILVCHGGIGESKLLRNKLNHEFNKLDIVISKSSTFIKKSDFENMDLIISTVPLKLNTDVNIIAITPLLKKQDIIRLDSIIKSIYSTRNTLSIKK